MANKKTNLQIPILEARLTEFMHKDEYERMEKQIERVAEFVFDILGYKKQEYRCMIHAMIKQHKLSKFYDFCVKHLRRTRNGHNWLAQSRFYDFEETSEVALYSDAKDIAEEYRAGRFALEKML